jgi:hypothetical protein
MGYVRLFISASRNETGAMCRWNRLPWDLLFSLRLEGEPVSRLRSGFNGASGDLPETVARRCREGVWICISGNI